jgi:hypothetical protein
LTYKPNSAIIFTNHFTFNFNQYYTGGLVFGLPLEQCIENDRLNNKKNTSKESRSARSSLSSLIDQSQREHSGSCESLPAKTSETEYLNSSFLPLFHSNLDRRSSHDDDELALLNIAGIQHSHVQLVPSLVLSCTKYLEENGLNTVGIFRVSTSKKRVRQVCSQKVIFKILYIYSMRIY